MFFFGKKKDSRPFVLVAVVVATINKHLVAVVDDHFTSGICVSRQLFDGM